MLLQIFTDFIVFKESEVAKKKAESNIPTAKKLNRKHIKIHFHDFV